jgi:hypothetical protein
MSLWKRFQALFIAVVGTRFLFFNRLRIGQFLFSQLSQKDVVFLENHFSKQPVNYYPHPKGASGFTATINLVGFESVGVPDLFEKLLVYKEFYSPQSREDNK